MRIREKIIFSFVFVIFSAGLIGYFLIGGVAQRALEDSIVEESSLLAYEILDKIDRNIFHRIYRWQMYSENPLLLEQTFLSNLEFSKMADPEGYIEEKNQEWISVGPEEITPFMTSLMETELSQDLKRITNFYKEEYGYAVFPEVFAANAYGANVGQSEKTSDYYQADEEWWQIAKRDGFYIQDVAYDESSDTYSVVFSFRISDSQGDFQGVLKVILNIEEAINVIQEFEPDNSGEISALPRLVGHKTLHFDLLTKDGRIIYSSENFNFLEDVKEILLNKLEGKNYVVAEDERFGHDQKELLAIAQSDGYRSFAGFGWYLLPQYEAKEVFQPVAQLRNIIILTIVLGIIVFIFIALHLTNAIVKPIKRLREGIAVVENNNLAHRVATKAKDEIGELSRAFDKMIASLQESWDSVDRKVKEQTKELRESRGKLEEQQKALLNILDDVEREKENVKKERDKIDTILHSIGDGVFVVDQECKIIVFNEIASEISGFSSQEALGRRYDEVLKFIYEKTGKVNNKFIQDAMATGQIASMTNHTILIKKDGVKVSVADSAAPLKNAEGKTIGCVVVFRDVTKDRELDQMKTDFISIASHQLRTPLTGIQWITERILKMEKLSPKIRGYLDDVRLSAQKLSGLVTDLLNASRFEEGNIAVMPEEIELVSFIQSYVKEMSSSLAKKKLKLEFKNHPGKMDILADRTLLRNIVQSLISNSIEYTNEKGKIEVSLEERENDFLFTIKDDGIGIPKEVQPTIFDKFTRAENAKTYKPSGSGLGLYLTKGAVDTVGGKIWLESEVDKGTTFFVQLPVKSKQKKGIKGFV